ncbi:N-acetylmuramoyl-L-alanine amidase [Gordonia sp. WA4-43]|uniref:N-acetylmuramoyl-L-alanine amidase n=1 Tax=Gordonia sp. WA4-43 TaxID=2878678 RepID=UPI001CFAD07A|nr:N-acetylmuramoyl-L-alanine amidase [Gordonia sp. WA4-43]UCZ88685.1 N-acetylmuramoyl-L-alanine amidase [Gordonia sp. WA4-43]
MPDYFKVQPDLTRLMNKHFSSGRGGRKVRYITLHHNAGISTTLDSWNTWQSRQASAHYQIEPSGRVGQLVYDGDTAWSNGNSNSNAESIAIEHSNSAGAAKDWPISDTVIAAGAKWTAALCWFYKLGRPKAGTNVRFHREFFGTSCPYHLAPGGKYHARYMKIAGEHYDWMVKGGAAPAPVINEINAEAERARAWIGKRLAVDELPTRPDGRGRYVHYENGTVYWHPDVRKTHRAGDRAIAVPKDIFETWSGMDFEAGLAGFPIERHRTIPGVGTIQRFQGGTIYRRFGEPGYLVGGAIGDRYDDLKGHEGPWGWPAGFEAPTADGGQKQKFEHDLALWHPSSVSTAPKEK